jgi:branched-subunit amino acid transport protein
VSAFLAWGLVIGMAVTNIVLRWTPLAIMSRIELPGVVRRWLGYVPVTVMGAIVAMQVLRPQGIIRIDLANPYLLAAVPTAVVYKLTSSFLGATLAGILSFLAFRHLLA